MNLTGREFLQMLAIAAAQGLPLDSGRASKALQAIRDCDDFCSQIRTRFLSSSVKS